MTEYRISLWSVYRIEADDLEERQREYEDLEIVKSSWEYPLVAENIGELILRPSLDNEGFIEALRKVKYDEIPELIGLIKKKDLKLRL